MGTTSDKLKYTSNHIDRIGEAIKLRNPTFDSTKPLEDWSQAVEEIDEWKPQSDWWDVKKILEEDNTINPTTGKPYPYKWIELIRNSYLDYSSDTVTLSGDSAYICSDNPTKLITEDKEYTFDKTKDKVCSKGYKTRYVLHLATQSKLTLPHTLVMWWVCAYEITVLWGNFKYRRVLESVEFLNNFTFDLTNYVDLFMECPNLQKVPAVIKTGKCSNIRYMFYQNPLLKTPCDFTDVSNIVNMECFMLRTNFNYHPKFTGVLAPISFYQTYYSSTLKFRDDFKYDFSFSRATSMRNFCYFADLVGEMPWGIIDLTNCNEAGCVNTYGLLSSYPTDLKIKDLKAGNNYSAFMYWERDSLLYTLTNLAIVNNKTLIIGAGNIAKLRPEEIALATEKGWVII